MSGVRVSPPLAAIVLLAATHLTPFTPPVSAQCLGFGPGIPLPNVVWGLRDSVAACPAGDTLYISGGAGHPSRLRIGVHYEDAFCTTRVGVPPESIWVTYTTGSGNLKVNDKGVKVFADDSTDANGDARITIPSFSGCGRLVVRLFVSGVNQGTRLAWVRTTDTDADGRVSGADSNSPCDLNYDGTVSALDIACVLDHPQHWHRNALHGTLVRRTNYCETCEEHAAGTKGDSQIAWSPSQRFISPTSFLDIGQEEASCKVFLVPADAADGDALTQVTFEPLHQHDYDPVWSPLNTEFVFDRADSVIIRRQAPWLGTTETVVTASNNPECGNERGDDIPAISPDGQWVAFSRCNGFPTGGWSLWKIPIGGGTAIQLTPAAARTDFYASWSPDGQTIYFQRRDDAVGPGWTIWKVPAAGGSAEQVFVPPASPVTDAVQPALSPDGAVLAMGFGERDDFVRNVITHTLDPDIATPSVTHAIPNYPDTLFADNTDFPILSPRLSPDGTRLALGSKQVWAARRNMNLPPRFTSVTATATGTQAIPDTAATLSFTFDPHETSTITVEATDPESDVLTYRASFLQGWMDWDPGTRTLSATPTPFSFGKTFHVKFWVVTPSGGADAFIAVVDVAPTFGSAARPALEEAEPLSVPQGVLAVRAPDRAGEVATLSVFDIAGRRVARIRGRGGEVLVWDGAGRGGGRVQTGIYLWRLEVGAHRAQGRLAVVR